MRNVGCPSVRVRAHPLVLLGCILVIANCPNPAGPSSSDDSSETEGSAAATPSVATISSASEAEAAVRAVKSACTFVDGKLAKGFSSPVSVSGASGNASASGKKTQEDSSTSYSSTTMKTTDISIVFSTFKELSTSAQLAGTVKWYDYYYSRFAYSSSGSASSTKETESISSTGLKVRFEYSGKTIEDTVDIAVDSPDYTSRWDGTIKTSSGKSYSIYGYL